ncbi:MAG TPA: hypothetical protein VFZ09_24925 [Archangium sp.]|uniref:hypothetical protein n=1 Tax=Archangium sp. TaxID=1872627 RepID=UPI002E34D170|nr:hypothetical protein [Archangium sp.]HEX5749496.1 hypothetical protein [Archangium sp.]
MDEITFIRQLEAWRATKDSQVLGGLLDTLLCWLPIRPPLVHALGQAVAEDMRMQVVETLLLKDPARLSQASSPRGYARAVLANKYRDELRAKSRQALWAHTGRAAEAATALHSQAEPDATTLLEREQRMMVLLHVLEALRLEERVALLLLYAPDRVTPEDWNTVGQRHPPPPPSRPAETLDRSAIAHLLFPGEPPETARERVTKLIQRTERKLREALARARESLGEEQP